MTVARYSPRLWVFATCKVKDLDPISWHSVITSRVKGTEVEDNKIILLPPEKGSRGDLESAHERVILEPYQFRATW